MWFVSMYKIKLNVVLVYVVFRSMLVELIIFDRRGKICNIWGMYWNIIMYCKVFFVFMFSEVILFMCGIMS